MNELFEFVFTAAGPVTALVIIALWLSRRPASTSARRFAIGLAIVYCACSIRLLAVGASRLLTIGYHQFAADDVGTGPTAIVLLGAGDEFIEGWTEHMTLTLPPEGARVLEAARVFRLISPAWIISSGGPARTSHANEATGVTMREELVQLGVPRDRILIETASRNTREEALVIEPMLRTLGNPQVVLVTSHTHMRRSMGALRAVGIAAIPAIARDPRPEVPLSEWILPTGRALRVSGEVVHELFGIPYYWLRGWWRS
ncbi:MAG TPA: YdcF family protein [Vicinamibacterales bacterium]|jgi:uncharacterized SAM-binding protein YcdF (DUF218 family)